MLQKVTAKTRKQKPLDWSALLSTSLKRPPHATCWSACRDFLQLLRMAVTAPMPPCRASNLFAPCWTSSSKPPSARITKGAGRAGIRHAIHPDQAASSPDRQRATPCNRNARLESRAQCSCHRWCPTTAISSIVGLHCGLAQAPSVCRGGSRSMMSLASPSFRVLLTLIVALPLSRRSSVSCFLQKL